jgi:hypothetical protein
MAAPSPEGHQIAPRPASRGTEYGAVGAARSVARRQPRPTGPCVMMRQQLLLPPLVTLFVVEMAAAPAPALLYRVPAPAPAAARRRPPPSFVPIDFVPDFEFSLRVRAMDPVPPNASVVGEIIFEWGWGQLAGETRGYLAASSHNFTRNKTAAHWVHEYPNSFGLRKQYFTGRYEDDSIMVTHLFTCHEGAAWRNKTLILPNQTTTIEVNVSLAVARGRNSNSTRQQQQKLSLGGTLQWRGLQGFCDDLGIVVGKQKSTGAPIVETFRGYNARKYWPKFQALPEPKHRIKRFPIMDGFRTGDGDLQAQREALRAASKLGLHGLTLSNPAWMQQQELGYKLTSVRSEVALLEWDLNAPQREAVGNMSKWAAQVVAPLLHAGYQPSEARGASPIHDEPGMAIPRDFPPALGSNASLASVKASWHSFLQAQELTPEQLGGNKWDDIEPSSQGGVGGSHASLEAKRLYYWSLRFVSWSSSSYLAKATHELEKLLTPETPIYVNWNNMAGHWYYPAGQVDHQITGQLNHDWFEHARLRGGTMLCKYPSQFTGASDALQSIPDSFATNSKLHDLTDIDSIYYNILMPRD